MHIGPHRLARRLLLVPMAVVADRPFCELCWDLGADLAVAAAPSLVVAARKTRRRLNHCGESFLATSGRLLPGPHSQWIRRRVLRPVKAIDDFYGTHLGVRIARKHFTQYSRRRPSEPALRAHINAIQSQQQLDEIERYFDRLSATEEVSA
jgi:tRNA-dihydrouridine synthase